MKWLESASASASASGLASAAGSALASGLQAESASSERSTTDVVNCIAAEGMGTVLTLEDI